MHHTLRIESTDYAKTPAQIKEAESGHFLVYFPKTNNWLCRRVVWDYSSSYEDSYSFISLDLAEKAVKEFRSQFAENLKTVKTIL